MKKFLSVLKRIVLTILFLSVLLTSSAFIYMCHPKFGKSPSGERLLRIQKSPNYKNGEFKNLTDTPTYAPGYSLWEELWKQVFNKFPRRIPIDKIPGIKTDLLHLPADSNVVVWFGHSSVFIQIEGKKILIDPVLSGSASPIPGSVKSFEGTDIYSVKDLPEIDYLLISHDHYDHLDYETVVALKSKVKKVVCGLGVGSHFEHWGYSADQIIEKDWNEKVDIEPEVTIFTFPARHKSGRGFSQNNTLWMSYLIKTETKKIFYSGDGGYDKHFVAVGNEFGPIDVAILENGQYDNAWHYVHMLPEEVLQAGKNLKARRILPVHNSKFVLARHPWDEPLAKISELNQDFNIPLITPMIGEAVNLNVENPKFKKWWESIE